MSAGTATSPPERMEVGPLPRRRRREVRRRVARAALAWLGTCLVLLVASLASSRGWRPPAPIAPLEVAPLPTVQPWDRHLPYAAVDRVDTVTATGARARVVRPHGFEGTIPGVVLVAGSGRTTRDDLAEEAEALARGGLAVLTYDKRTEGYSVLQRRYDRLATDALAALDVVAQQPGVDPGRVGLLGFSEGGWVVPLAAELARGRVRLAGRPPVATVAFVVLVSAPVVSPLDQAAWATDRALASAPTGVRAASAAALVLGRPVVDYLDTDVTPALATSTQPAYAVWGADDPTVPVGVAVERFRGAVGVRGRVQIVPGAGHRVPVATGWAEEVSDWVRRGYPEDEEIRGGQPTRLVGLATLPRTSPVGDPRLTLVLSVGVALVVGLWPRRRRA